MAKVGFEGVEEIQDPQLAMTRMKAIYRAKGYSDDWMEKAPAASPCARS